MGCDACALLFIDPHLARAGAACRAGGRAGERRAGGWVRGRAAARTASCGWWVVGLHLPHSVQTNFLPRTRSSYGLKGKGSDKPGGGGLSAAAAAGRHSARRRLLLGGGWACHRQLGLPGWDCAAAGPCWPRNHGRRGSACSSSIMAAAGKLKLCTYLNFAKHVNANANLQPPTLPSHLPALQGGVPPGQFAWSLLDAIAYIACIIRLRRRGASTGAAEPRGLCEARRPGRPVAPLQQLQAPSSRQAKPWVSGRLPFGRDRQTRGAGSSARQRSVG